MLCRVCPRSRSRSQVTVTASNKSTAPRHHQQDEFYPLTCGDTYCRACLAELARQCLLSHQLIPLRCCQRRVPVEWIENVLEQPEFGYYRFLVDKKSQRQSQSQQTLVIEVDDSSVQPATTQCAGCDLSSSRSKADPTIALECGHQYCLECLAELCRSDWGIGAAPSCCSIPLSTDALHQLQELHGAATTTKPVAATTKSAASMIIIDDDELSGFGDHTGAQSSQRRRQSKRLLFGKMKAKKTKPSANEIDLVDSPEPISTVRKPYTEYADPEAEDAAEDQRAQCFTCKRMVLTSEAACGHGFCLKCLDNRCRQAVENDKDGGIGFLLRCCGQVLALEVVRPALSVPLFTQYKALVAKREDDMKQLAKRKRGAGKQKAKPKAQSYASSSTAATTPSKPPPAKRLRLGGSAAPTVDEEQKEQDEPDIVEVADHFECVACMEQLSEKAQRFRGPCGHVYCTECLELMAKKALEDRLLVPIRCCGKELPVEYVARVLSRRNLGTYNRFLKEKDWKTSNLRSDKEYAKLIEDIGGLQCPRCGIGVQKITGCNAMVCSHGHRFCWGCGEEKCSCATNSRRY